MRHEPWLWHSFAGEHHPIHLCCPLRVSAFAAILAAIILAVSVAVAAH